MKLEKTLIAAFILMIFNDVLAGNYSASECNKLLNAGNTTAAIDYSKALQALIELKSPIDAFFDGVLVNAPEPDIRANRLSLLRKIDKLFLGIGDLSQIQVQSS